MYPLTPLDLLRESGHTLPLMGSIDMLKNGVMHVLVTAARASGYLK